MFSICIVSTGLLAQTQRYPVTKFEQAVDFQIQATGEILQSYALIQDDDAYVEDEEENLPFDDESGSGFMNWVAKLFLWFIYLMLAIMLLGGTWWSFTAKGFWSWAVCLIAVFFYAMLLGRYWGYGFCLILFGVLFSIVKVVVHFPWGKKKLDS